MRGSLYQWSRGETGAMTKREEGGPARCAWCGRVRDGTSPGGWAPSSGNEMDEAARSYGVCPDCHRELMREADARSGRVDGRGEDAGAG